MNSAAQQRGFAIALILWMIAGMSLMVAAVIHFARADTGMAELRVREAKARALGRGVAHLLLRDSALATYRQDDQNAEPPSESERDAAQQGKQKLFTKQYQFGDGWVISATLRPSSGFVSLNNADGNELLMLFKELGGMTERDAMAMTEGVLEYRVDFPGFRYPEELLAVANSSRVAYDNVKAYVHTYRTGSLVGRNAPLQLAGLAREESAMTTQHAGQPAPANGSGRGQIEGRITFESIAEAIRNPAGAADQSISAAEMAMTLPGGVRLEQTVWVSGDGVTGVLRSGPITVNKTRRGNP